MLTRREEFINENQQKWIETGARYKVKREKLGLLVSDISCQIGVSNTTLRNFEAGKPIKSAIVVENAYRLFLNLYKSIKITEDQMKMIDKQQKVNEQLEKQLKMQLGYNNDFEELSLLN